jgi:hypothetical protein
MFEDQELKEFDHWLMFADFESHSCFQYHPTSFFVEKVATHLRQQRGQGRNLMALFRDFCFNSPAALAAGEIRVKKKAPLPTRKWLYVLCVSFLPNAAWSNRAYTDKNKI